MIETAGIHPRLYVVTCLAAYPSTIGPFLGHAVIEFAPVGIHVTGRAIQVFELKRQYFVVTFIRAFLMTVSAGNCRVRTIQWESRVAMHGDRKFRPVKIIHRVARFATVLVRRLCELPVMSVLVTIRALREFDFENCIRSGWDMALGAFHAGMLAQQWVCGSGVRLHTERTRLPSIHGVTFCAFAFPRMRLKLPFVRIGIVAVHTLGMRHRCLEITIFIFVAIVASDGAMLSEQRKMSC